MADGGAIEMSLDISDNIDVIDTIPSQIIIWAYTRGIERGDVIKLVFSAFPWSLNKARHSAWLVVHADPKDELTCISC